MIFLAEATPRKHWGGCSYIAFKFSFTGNLFVLEAGIVVIKYEVQWNSYLSVTLLFLFFLFSVLIPRSKWTRFFASLVKRNLRLKFLICGTCSGVDRLKLPLKIFQKSDSVCSVFEMTNVIVIKKEMGNFSCFCQATLWKLLGLGEVWNVLSAIHYPRVWITVSNSPNNL